MSDVFRNRIVDDPNPPLPSNEFSVGKTADMKIEVVLVEGSKEVRVRCKNDEEFMQVLNALQEEWIAEESKVASYYGISLEAASSVVYLRGRSRWTPDKEQLLVDLARAGEKLPNVYSGEL